MALSPRRVLVALLVAVATLAAGGCGGSRVVREQAEAAVASARNDALDCDRDDRCALPTPLAGLVERSAATPDGERGRHFVNLLDLGEESLALRVHLIRAARERIDLQTFIFSEDDVGYLTLDELLKAARRGVKVRLLLDQLFSFDNTALFAKLARAHANFEIRLYNPTFTKAKTAPLEFAAGILCCFMHFNQRMHNKLLLVDGLYGVNGGRNVDERYFDWSESFNYRDRDVLVVGPATSEMQASFDAYWNHRTAVPLTSLSDVGREILEEQESPQPLDTIRLHDPERLLAIGERASDDAWIRRTFVEGSYPVARVEYFADLPNKGNERHEEYDRDITSRIAALLAQAKDRIVMQTPYLVLSKAARDLFEQRRKEHPGLEILVSTNSLAATDAFYVYAVSHKHKRKYLRRLGFEIHEYKPFPGRGAPTVATEPVRVGASGTFGREALRARQESVPLTKPGVRRGLHAKSIAIDGQVALIGTHNFDPRSDRLNTESGVIVWDSAFAAALEASIRNDATPDNAWVIAKRQKAVPVVGEVNTVISTVSETLPLFDLWPFRYATSYQLRDGCEAKRPSDPGFYDCYDPVGDFPEVNLSLKAIYARIITAFGAPLAPIL
ncbi:MAG TPA: phospholipase D family protein [Xanthomonadales bacterium]|nr:phospholipase D family protein [Xanthomonadales bacterium]